MPSVTSRLSQVEAAARMQPGRWYTLTEMAHAWGYAKSSDIDHVVPEMVASGLLQQKEVSEGRTKRRFARA